jgi:hypothetical protein
MATLLHTVSSGIPPGAIVTVIPPTCAPPVASDQPGVIQDAHDDGETLVTLPAWPLPAATRELIPSFALLTDREYSLRLELSLRMGGGWSPWLAGAPLGPARFDDIPSAVDGITSDVDLFRCDGAPAAVRVRVRLRAPDARALIASPWLAALSASDLAPPLVAGRPSGGAQIPVPGLSQMTLPAAIARRVCSPASVAMVLEHWGHRVDVAALAAEMYHSGLDRYGVWPEAIRAGARRGLAGYLLRFPGWSAAMWCLDRGLPIVASVRYAAGELTGAPVAETDGHLLVLTGYEGGEVLVNDPAAPAAPAVPRRYRLDELHRAWLERTGLGYVFFDPSRPPDDVADEETRGASTARP